jgi:hypothetical protein
MMEPLVFNGETKLSSISEDSTIRVVIEISLPPPQEGQDDLVEARMVLSETYSNMAGMIANYLGAVQYELIENPKIGVASALIIFKHIKKAVEEVMVNNQENAGNKIEPERDFLKSYQ